MFGETKSFQGLRIFLCISMCLLPNGMKEREVLGVGSIPGAILPSCQGMYIFG